MNTRPFYHAVKAAESLRQLLAEESLLVADGQLPILNQYIDEYLQMHMPIIWADYKAILAFADKVESGMAACAVVQCASQLYRQMIARAIEHEHYSR